MNFQMPILLVEPSLSFAPAVLEEDSLVVVSLKRYEVELSEQYSNIFQQG